MALYLLLASAAYLAASLLAMHFLLIWIDSAYSLTATCCSCCCCGEA